MIAKEVIMAVLVGIAVTGVIPFIGGIVLLLMGKIKGSSFWAGVLAYIISMIGITIVSAVLAVQLMDMMQNKPMMFSAIAAVITGVCTVLSMGVCIGACMKNNTFNGALSCGLGFGISYSLTSAISFISIYAMAGMINNGSFDQRYSAAIDAGVMTKEDLNDLKAQFTELTFSDCIVQIVVAIAFAAVLTACAIFIMRGKCTKDLAVGILTSIIVASAEGLAVLVPNVAAAAIVAAAIGAAALFFAFRMKDKVVMPEAPVVYDSFMGSIEKARNGNDNSDPFNN